MAAAVSNCESSNELPPSFLDCYHLKGDLAEKISQKALETIKSDAEMIAHAFNENPYRGKFWNDENFRSWPIFAIEAHERNFISIFQAATIIFQYAVIGQFVNKIRAYSAYVEKNKVSHILGNPPIRKDAHFERIHLKDRRFNKILTKLLKPGKVNGYLKTDQDIKEAVEHIKKSLKNEPFSEQYLFMMDGITFMKGCSPLLDFYNKKVPFPFSGSFFLNNELKFATPSFSILQAFFKFLRPSSPIILDPSFDEPKVQEENKIVIDLQLPLYSRFIFVNGMFAGRVGFFINNAIRQPLNLSSHSTNDNKAIAYLKDLLDQYIQITEAWFEGNLELFFAKYKIENPSKKEGLKNKLQWDDDYIDWLITEVLKNLDVSKYHLKLDMSDFDSTGFKPEATNTAKFDLANLKKLKFKSCLAKKFHRLLASRFIERFNKITLLESIFSDPFFKALFILNSGIYNLIVRDLSLNAELWEEFGITEDEVFPEKEV